MNKAGSRQVLLAQHMLDPCATRRLLQLMAVRVLAWERPPGPQQVPVGAISAALLLFPKGGSSLTPSGSPGGGCPSLGRCRGDYREELLSREQGCPSLLPPSVLDSQNSGWVSSAWRQ